MFVRNLLVLLLFPCLISTEPLELTDKTWKNILHGQWMIEFYTTWCGACQKFKPVWNDFSIAMSFKNIKVAAIDVDRNPSLSGRFRITALPTVYYVRDGVFRRFNGERSLKTLQNYIESEEWQKTEPVSSYLAPDSILYVFNIYTKSSGGGAILPYTKLEEIFSTELKMSLTDSVFDAPVFVKNVFKLLKDQYGLATWLIYTIFAFVVFSIGIASAFVILFIFDYFVGGLSKVCIKPVSLDAGVSEKLLKSKEQTITTVNPPTSSVENRNDDLKERLEISDVEIATDEQTIRQRRLEK